MIAHYGYQDGSGEYLVSVNSVKCTACGKCVEICPPNILEIGPVFMDLDEQNVAQIKESFRKNIREACAECDHIGGEPCIKACEPEAIKITWTRSD